MTAENIGGGTWFGDWSKVGVPHKGWICIDMEDQGDDLVTCEMCETAQVRYVHVMRNERWPGELRVGCVCAERMEEDASAAKEREARFKRRFRNPKLELNRTLIVTADKI